MSYPPPTYRGDGGETSATFRPASTPPQISNQPGNDVHYLATGESTGGQLGLYRWEFGPKRSGPDPHFHRAITETFYVLSGEVQLYDGRGWRTGRPGDLMFVPEGGLHGFRGADRASMLLLFAPGAPREDYFETLAAGEPMTAEERAEFMLRHDTYWV